MSGYKDISECMLVSVRPLDGNKKCYGGLVGKKVLIDHDELLRAEIDIGGVGFELVDSTTSLIINGITKVEYMLDKLSDLQYIAVYNEGYRYEFVEEV